MQGGTFLSEYTVCGLWRTGNTAISCYLFGAGGFPSSRPAAFHCWWRCFHVKVNWGAVNSCMQLRGNTCAGSHHDRETRVHENNWHKYWKLANRNCQRFKKRKYTHRRQDPVLVLTKSYNTTQNSMFFSHCLPLGCSAWFYAHCPPIGLPQLTNTPGSTSKSTE